MHKEGPQEVNIHPDGLKTTLKKLANWKSPGRDGIHGFWFLKFCSKHDRLATEINKCIHKTEIAEWMTKGKTTLIQKNSLKGTVPNKYRLIKCLPMIWQILTAQIR